MWSKLKNLKQIDRDDLLEMVGLERRRSAADWVLPAVGFFGLGMLVGAGLGLMLAPKPGAQLREDLRRRLQQGMEPLAGAFPEATPVPERPKVS